jgi:L-amino acid N-acyltransferase YncA
MIRDAVAADAARIAAIYAHHVLRGTATFDTVPPDAGFFAEKIVSVQAQGWPFLAADLDGVLAGYAYATQIRPRPAYAMTAEDSIYVAHGMTGRGVGRALLAALLDRSAACGFTQMIAVIGGGEPASIALHTALGFREVGRLEAVGFKFGRWLDSVYMQKALIPPAAA